MDAFERAEHQAARRLDAADRLDDHVDVRIGDDRLGVVREHTLGEHHVAILGEVAHGDTHRVELHSGTPRDQVPVLVEEPDQRRADVAAPQNPDPDLSHVPSVAQLHTVPIGFWQGD